MFTVLLPVLPLSVWFNLSMVPMIWVLLIYATWCLVALLLMGSMVRAQQADVDWRISEKVDEVLGQLRDLETKREEDTEKITGLEGHLDQVEEAMRSAFAGIGVELPGRRHSVRAGTVSFSIQVPEVQGEGRGESRIARLRHWVQSKVQWVWYWVKRIVWDWDGAA